MINISKFIFTFLIFLFITIFAGAFGYNYFFKSDSNNEVNNDLSTSTTLLGELVAEKGIILAVYELEKRLDENPKDTVIIYQLAVANFMLAGTQDQGTRVANNRFTQEGLRYMQQAIDYAPDNLSYRAFYAIALEEIREDELAVEQFQILYKNDSFRQMAKYEGHVINYAEALERLGKKEQALQELKKSLALHSDNQHMLSAYKKIQSKIDKES